MVTVQHVMYLLARAVHHRVDDAQVGDILFAALLVAYIIVATYKVETDAHLAESLLVVEFSPSDRVQIVGTTVVQAGATDYLRSLAVPTG